MAPHVMRLSAVLGVLGSGFVLGLGVWGVVQDRNSGLATLLLYIGGLGLLGTLTTSCCLWNSNRKHRNHMKEMGYV